MNPLLAQLANYAAYHRDRRNLATHYVGVPMILFAVTVLFSRPVFGIGGLSLSPAWLVAAAAAVFYFRLSLGWGVVMSGVLTAALLGAAPLAALETSEWLAWGLGLFVVGWIIQALGHVFEGRKPAFLDDVRGLLVGPLFVAAEFAFHLGLARGLQAEIEAIAGPTRVGRADRSLAR